MKSYVCTDIGSCMLKMGMNDHNRSGMDSIPNKLVQAGAIVSYDAMAEQMEKLVKEEHLGKNAAVILPASKVYVRTLYLPAMSDEQMKINLPYEFKDYVGDAEKDYIFDYAIMDTEYTEDGKPAQLQILAAAVLKSVVSEYMEMFKKAGMKLSVIAPEEMGYSNLVRNYLKSHTSQKDELFCFVDLGHTATRIHVLDGAIYSISRNVDVGGQDLDNAIGNELGVDQFLAHEYKELNKDECRDLSVCNDIYERIAVEVMRAVNFFSYNNNGKELTKLYVCGGGKNIRQLIDAIAEHNPDLTICDASQLYPSELTKSGEGLTPAALGVSLL